MQFSKKNILFFYVLSIAAGVGQVANAGDIEQILPPASNFTIDGNGGAEVMRVQSDGKVGIGTTTPNEKLEVNGHIRMTDGNEAANTVMVGDAAGTASWAPISIFQDGTGTDDQILQDFNLTGTSLYLSIESGNTVNVDLNSTFATDAELSALNTNDADADPTNELNANFSLNGTSLEITDAGGTLSQDLNNTFATDAELAALNINDADSDPTNELITATDFNGTHLTITDAGGVQTIDLTSLTNQGTDDQQLQSFTLNGSSLSLTLEDGGTVNVDLSDLNDTAAITAVQTTLNTHIANDNDTDANNELNTNLSLNGTSIEITDAGGTLSQDLNSTFATDAELAALNINDADSDPTNEIQTLTSTDGSVTLTQSGNDYDLSVPAQVVTTITNTVTGNKIADYTNESGATTAINETITTLIQQPSPNQLDYKYTSENGTETTFRSSPIVAFGKVNSDGTAAKIYGASVTRISKGHYRVTLDSPRSSADYTIQLTIRDSAGAGNDDYDLAYSNQQTDSFVVEVGDNDNGGGNRANRDFEFMFTVIDY